jgi:hypothetical protein
MYPYFQQKPGEIRLNVICGRYDLNCSKNAQMCHFFIAMTNDHFFETSNSIKSQSSSRHFEIRGILYFNDLQSRPFLGSSNYGDKNLRTQANISR